MKPFGMLLGCVLAFAGAGWVRAADLQPATIQTWADYIQTAKEQMSERLEPGHRFLWLDENPERLRKVRDGAVVAQPAHERNPVPVPNGLIHDWIGAAFFPGVSLHDVFSVVRDYNRYKAVYKPEVVASTRLGHSANEDWFSMTVLNQALFARTALKSDYQETFVQVDDRRWYGISHTTRIQEVAGFGSSEEHLLPVGAGSGYIWRLFSISRFEERDGGVYVELRAVALSRDIPASLRWLVNPIVRRIARGSLITSLEQTRQAVRCPDEAEQRRESPAGYPATLLK